MLQFAEDGNMMWLFNVMNVIFIIILAFVDFFYFLGVAKDRKRCTNREWRQGTKGFRNTVTWEGIRKYVPKYLYVHHIITLSVMSLAILSQLFSLMGLYMRQTYVCLTGSVSGALSAQTAVFFLEQRSAPDMTFCKNSSPLLQTARFCGILRSQNRYGFF